VPTYERLERFLREYRRLSPEMREAFLEALQGGVMRLRGRECEPPGTCAHEPS
jgi:hypothetical protein